MNLDFTHKFVKYLIEAIIIYLLFKFVPKTPMNDRDIVIITGIIIASIITYENIYGLLSIGKSFECADNCSKEHMGNLSYSEMLSDIGLDSKKPTALSENKKAVYDLLFGNTFSTDQPVELSDNSSIQSLPNNSVGSDNPVNPMQLVTSVSSNATNTLLPTAKKFPDVVVTSESIGLPATTQAMIPTQTTTTDRPTITQTSAGEYNIPVYKSEYVGAVSSRSEDDVLVDENQLNDPNMYSNSQAFNSKKYTDYNTLPSFEINSGSFEYGYSFLPPTAWYPTPPHPPVCVSEKRAPVCPVYTDGAYVDLKEWNSSRRITPPDQINTKYIEEKLNSGR